MKRQPLLSKHAAAHCRTTERPSRRSLAATLFGSCAPLFFLLLSLTISSRHAAAQAASATAIHPMKIGIDVDNWSNQAADSRFEASLVAMSPDFVSWHLAPWQETSANLSPMVLLCRKHGWGYTFNNEWGNYNRNQPALLHADGTYRYDFADSTLQLLKDDPLFLGVIYDENELMQVLNGISAPDGSGIILPSLAQTASMTAPAAFDAVAAKVATLEQRYASYGKRLIFEEVFPDNAHVIARGGAIMAPKLLKENYDDLMYAVYRGAATEYKSAELWTCIDLWFLNNFPTNGVGGNGFHTPQDLLTALTYANAAGFDYAYIEQYKGLMDSNFNLTAYGQAVVTFQQRKASATRGNWRTVPVQGYVRRFPDGNWGQRYSYAIPDHPYGSSVANAFHAKDTQWFTLLQNESNGAFPTDADNWNATSSPFFSSRPYAQFAGLPTFLVYDHYGTLPKANGVPTVDLCGSNQNCLPQ